MPKRWAGLDDIAVFIDGSTDDDRLTSLLRGLSLVDWAQVTSARPTRPTGRLPPAAFSLLFLTQARGSALSKELHVTPGLVGKAVAGDLLGATARARRRLVGAGLLPTCGPISLPPQQTRRIAAALLFPIAPEDQVALRQMVLR